MNYYVYILLCNNGNYYTGYTTNLKRRYQEHLDGSIKCKYTRSFKPLALAQSWSTFDNKLEALKMERFIKTLSKSAKKNLILNPEQLTHSFQCETYNTQLIQTRVWNEKYNSCHR